MIQTEDLNVTGVNPLTAPKFIKAEHPISDKASETVFKFRKQIKDVLDEKDSRQLVIVGPCSIHHSDIALDYADKLTKLIPEVEDKLLKIKGRIVSRKILPISLSYDHRIIDGAEGARFCVYLSECLGKDFAFKLAV